MRIAIRLIRQETARSDESRYDHRLHGLLLVTGGQSCQQVAELFGEDRRTVESGRMLLPAARYPMPDVGPPEIKHPVLMYVPTHKSIARLHATLVALPPGTIILWGILNTRKSRCKTRRSASRKAKSAHLNPPPW